MTSDELLLAVCQALVAPLDALDAVVSEDDTHPAWTRAVDVDAAPLWVLPWLASLVGVQWVGPPSEQLRGVIRTRPRWKRGTPGAIRNAALDTMSAAATLADVLLLERTTPPWTDTLLISAAKSPDHAMTAAAALAEMPAMRALTIVFSDAPIFDVGTRAFDAASATFDGAQLADVT
jgi:hypothetical protein